MRSWRRWWGPLGGAVAFVAAGWTLLRLGRVDWLLIDWSDLGGWLDSVGTETALAALARIAGLTALAWIGLSTLIYLAARLLGARPGSVDWLSIGPVRRSIDALLAGYLVMGSIAPAGAAVDPVLTEPAPVTTDDTITAVDPAYVPVPAGSGRAEGDTEVEEATETEEAQPQPLATTEATMVVAEPGDHLWKLAERRMTTALGRSPTEAEIAPYWVEVVEANRDRIRSGDPDLIFPGEQIALPALTREN